MTDAVRVRRLAVGWSQAELAAAAGVSRQSVAAVEAGRNVPSVSAALRLAGVLGCSVEELFADSVGEGFAPALPGTPEPAEGTPLAVTRVGGTTVWSVLEEPGEGGFRLADAVWEDGGPRLLEGATPEGCVVAGCEPALGTAASAGPPRGAGRVLVVHASSGPALEALAAGRVHAAVVHGPAGGLPEVPDGVVRWELTRWPVGLAHRGGGPAPADVAAGRVPVAQREARAAAQQALLRALGAVDGAPGGMSGAPDRDGRGPGPRGPLAAGHLAAARMTAEGRVAAGVTTAAAAGAMGLGFTALEEHVVQLWTDRRFVDHPGLAVLLQLWCSPRVGAQLRRLGGYDLAAAGKEIR
ncbi:helix-turn-helix transcriptional regulator [Streptomyces sp. ST2-7A]|uniref:helix-turn-helix transcriptional regulator n=1 Tax=Streptomyces sp. ST2-7A TaxID=2907214 RepID=UPI001F2E74E1|nr:helix-turn-helix domain-containing protein [Streptomyces sp. ST2-7A]MCE7080423.1 helix-turn-helix domain-containing protein [Streptomyces sp. ST2-7A]